MTACESVRTGAAGLAALPPDDPERAAAWAHARLCPPCARLVRESEALQGLLAEGGPAPLPAPVMARVSRMVLELRARGRRRVAWATVAACTATLLLVAFGRARSSAAGDWILAAVLCAAAASLVALTRRLSLEIVAAAVALAAVAAGLSDRAGPLEAAVGLHCSSLEIASAGAVVGGAWLAVRGGLAAIGRRFIVGAAAAGALAGDAALHLTCRAHASLPHVLVFHLGGIVLAALVASLVWRVAAKAEA